MIWESNLSFFLLLKLSTLIIGQKMYTMRDYVTCSWTTQPNQPTRIAFTCSENVSNTFCPLHGTGWKNFKSENVALFFQKSKHANIDHVTWPYNIPTIKHIFLFLCMQNRIFISSKYLVNFINRRFRLISATFRPFQNRLIWFLKLI